ncbi:MAG: HAD-IA family hydrolase [Bacteroidales bacterium]|nr:HAD-IA family hydrolase [Bacteroidales bacterium]
MKNIIFDFGGVIYDIDHSLSKKAFLKLGVSDFDQLYGHDIQTDLFEKMERGEIGDHEFRNALRKYLPAHISDNQIDHAWCALLLGFEKQRIDLLQFLGENYRLFILSNSNIIHANQFLAELNEYSPFRKLFEDVWFSHEKGMRKPEKEFYQGLIDKHHLNLEETLFIDDLEVNILAAQELGLQTHLLKPNESILDLFDHGQWVKSDD